MASGTKSARAGTLLTLTLLGAGALGRVLLGVADEALGTVSTALRDGPDPATLPAALTVLAAAAALLSLAWLALVLTATTLSALSGGAAQPAAGSALRPRLAVLVVGAVLGGTGVPSVAAAPAASEDARGQVERRLVGLPLPDRPVGKVASPSGPRARAGTDPTAVVVRAGDSLWSIAERLLPRGTGDAVVDRTWRHIYAGNRDRLGPDPDLIHPGTPLRLPAHLDAPGAAP